MLSRDKTIGELCGGITAGDYFGITSHNATKKDSSSTFVFEVLLMMKEGGTDC